MQKLSKVLPHIETGSSDTLEAEVRAFVYQKLSELEGVIPDGTSLNVVLQKSGQKHVARIDIKTAYGPISSIHEDKNIYSAISPATEMVHNQLDAIHQVVSANSDTPYSGYLH